MLTLGSFAPAGSATAPPPVSSLGTTAPANRASWSGFLRLSLVVLPVKAYPAVSTAEDISFNQLHVDCGQRIQYQKHCPVHGKVDGEAIARGYQYAPGQYVVIEPSELEQLRPAKDKGLVLEQFVDVEQLEPVLFAGRSLYLFPDGLPAQRPYLVLQEAMRQKGRWALGRISWSGHRQVVVVRPCGRLLSLHVLHDPLKVRSGVSLETQIPPGKASDEERQLASTLIDSATTAAVDWSVYHDDTAQKLAALIEAKVQQRPVVAPADEPVEVLQLLDALKQSVAAVRGRPASAGSKGRKRSLSVRRRSA